MTRRFICTVAAALFVAPTLSAQPLDKPGSLARQLGDAGSGKVNLPPHELATLVQRGLEDRAAREVALLTIVGRNARTQSKTTEAAETWRAEQKALSGLRGDVENVLSDEDATIRAAAVMALGAIAANPSRLPELEIDAPAWASLTEVFRRDQSTTVRAQVMKMASLSAGSEKARMPVIRLGLDDSNTEVISHAIRGAGNLGMVEALPHIVEFLVHPDKRVRLAAAISLPAFGKAAVNYLGPLETAAANEPDDIVKKTMLGSLTALRGAR